MQAVWRDTFELQRIPGIDGRARRITGEAALFQTYRNLFSQLITLSDLYHIVFEDDIVPTDAWASAWPELLAWIQENPTGWDFISLDPFLHFDSAQLMRFTPSLFVVSKFRNMGAMIYNADFLRRCQRDFTKAPLDMTMTHDMRYKKLTPTQLLIKQSGGASSIAAVDVSHRDEFYRLTEGILAHALDPSKPNPLAPKPVVKAPPPKPVIRSPRPVSKPQPKPPVQTPAVSSATTPKTQPAPVMPPHEGMSAQKSGSQAPRPVRRAGRFEPFRRRF